MVICRSGYSARAAEHVAPAAAIKIIAGSMRRRIRPARGRFDMGGFAPGRVLLSNDYGSHFRRRHAAVRGRCGCEPTRSRKDP
jgi:hypothetical protein